MGEVAVDAYRELQELGHLDWLGLDLLLELMGQEVQRFPVLRPSSGWSADSVSAAPSPPRAPPLTTVRIRGVSCEPSSSMVRAAGPPTSPSGWTSRAERGIGPDPHGHSRPSRVGSTPTVLPARHLGGGQRLRESPTPTRQIAPPSSARIGGSSPRNTADIPMVSGGTR